jgi:hypothetical protein
MSIETARIESLRDPSSSKKACRVALLRPGRHQTIAPERWSATGGQVAVMAAVRDLVDADADQALEAALVEPVGGHPRDDPPDRVPADPEQPRDRGLWPSAGPSQATTFSKSRVCAAPGRAHATRLYSHAAGVAAQQSQLALDHAAARA